MLPEQFATIAYMRLTELLRKRELPGVDRREPQRQADFEARYCDMDTEYCSSKEAAAEKEEGDSL